MTRFWRQAGTIARRDLLVEVRAGEAVSVVLPFAAVAVFVVPLAVDLTAVELDGLAAPVFWLVALLFGMQVALRQTGTETATQRRHLALAGLDPVARFAGRAAAGGALVVALVAVLGPLVILFYSPDPVPGLGWMAPVLLLFGAGLAMLATLAGDVTVGLRTRSVLAPLLVAPLSVPLVVGGSQALQALAQGRSTLPWTLVLVIADLALAAAGVLTARSLEDAAT